MTMTDVTLQTKNAEVALQAYFTARGEDFVFNGTMSDLADDIADIMADLLLYAKQHGASDKQCSAMHNAGWTRFGKPDGQPAAFEITLVWSTDDVLQEHPHLNAEQAKEVLEFCSDTHDCSMGVSWTTIASAVETLGFDAPEDTE